MGLPSPPSVAAARRQSCSSINGRELAQLLRRGTPLLEERPDGAIVRRSTRSGWLGISMLRFHSQLLPNASAWDCCFRASFRARRRDEERDPTRAEKLNYIASFGQGR